MSWLKRVLNVRTWPHPGYGNYLGAERRCESINACKIPVDRIDWVGKFHDIDVRIDGKPHADLLYAWRMLKINPVTTRYERPIYGRAYQYGSAIVMGLLGVFSTPIRYFQQKE